MTREVFQRTAAAGGRRERGVSISDRGHETEIRALRERGQEEGKTGTRKESKR